jgi:hypothetical protein
MAAKKVGIHLAFSSIQEGGIDMQEMTANRRWRKIGTLVAVVFGAIVLGTGSASAGACAAAIARIEAALDALTSNPNGSVVHQSLRAQLHRQPSPGSVARGQQQAIADELHDRAALERARAADAKNDEAGCMKALPDVRHGLVVR